MEAFLNKIVVQKNVISKVIINIEVLRFLNR